MIKRLQKPLLGYRFVAVCDTCGWSTDLAHNRSDVAYDLNIHVELNHYPPVEQAETNTTPR